MERKEEERRTMRQRRRNSAALDGYGGILCRSVGLGRQSTMTITDRHVDNNITSQYNNTKQYANHLPQFSRTLSRASTVVSPTPRFASSILVASALPSMTSLSASTWSPTSMSS